MYLYSLSMFYNMVRDSFIYETELGLSDNYEDVLRPW